MPENITIACAKLKEALSNECAVERYITMINPGYVHPGWKALKETVYGRRKISTK